VKFRDQPLFGGQQLAEWIRAGGRPERRVAGYFQRLRWHAYWFEHNWRTQTRAISDSPLPEDPVFIIGPWRSGTTVLHELLAATTHWATPETWQCFHPSTCLLSKPPALELSTDRPMDQGHIRTRSPQEDEFALLLLGEPSLYRGFIDPRRLGRCAEELWSSADKGELKRWQGFIRCVMRGVTERQLLLKSPSHTFRLPLLRPLFPRAKFIWMGRHIGEMLASNVRMWHAMTRCYGLWNCPRTVLDGFLQDMLRECSRVLTQCLDDMPRESMLWVDFEELRTDPRQVLERIWRFISPNLAIDETIARRLDQALTQVPVHEGSRASLPADESVQKLEKLMTAARRQFGPPRQTA
jgi:omega-hydroxy-beta-dihydromenaquinone-9 sulfotransferase